MKFLFDENIGWLAVEFFRNNGYDIKSILDDSRGSEDKEVLKIASEEKRIVVTLDKDFCDLIFRDSISCHGVILLRLPSESQRDIICVLKGVFRSAGNELENSFTVATDKNIRIRKIKKTL